VPGPALAVQLAEGDEPLLLALPRHVAAVAGDLSPANLPLHERGWEANPEGQFVLRAGDGPYRAGALAEPLPGAVRLTLWYENAGAAEATFRPTFITNRAPQHAPDQERGVVHALPADSVGAPPARALDGAWTRFEADTRPVPTGRRAVHVEYLRIVTAGQLAQLFAGDVLPGRNAGHLGEVHER